MNKTVLLIAMIVVTLAAIVLILEFHPCVSIFFRHIWASVLGAWVGFMIFVGTRLKDGVTEIKNEYNKYQTEKKPSTANGFFDRFPLAIFCLWAIFAFNIMALFYERC